MTEMIKCKKCGGKGKLVNLTGLIYAQCSHCTKWDPYQFLGFTVEDAVRTWNIYNSSGKIVEEEL